MAVKTKVVLAVVALALSGYFGAPYPTQHHERSYRKGKRSWKQQGCMI